MSMWTYVRGMILADAYAGYTPAALYQAQLVVDHLPRITGSGGEGFDRTRVVRPHAERALRHQH